ncbi:MAG: radical SAM protein [Muribaculum sp.]|nr:radical SAM protein [Muribaculum sp.]
MKYTKSDYILTEDLDIDTTLGYSSVSNKFLILKGEKRSVFANRTVDELKEIDAEFFGTLVDNRFIVPSDLNETESITNDRRQHILDQSWYNVVVNTTLDCNLDCWYCYENRVKSSKISDEVITNICDNIEQQFISNPFTLLKISFFGGEPLLQWNSTKKIIDFGSEFCHKNGLQLLLDFTTNATLINERMVDYLAPFSCNFQITLDGPEEIHNKIKSTRNPRFNSYRRTLQALRLINDRIPNRLVAVRINFDQNVLKEADSIISDISFLDRRRTYVIVKKVWQVDRDDVDKDMLLDVLQKLFDNDFLPDYYVMPKGGVCFAERSNQVLFNYDGGIFKCTTINSFVKENSLGEFNKDTKLIDWDENLINEWTRDMQQPECLECKWYGACYGPCNRQLIAHKNQFICTFDAMNLTHKEYLIYLLKYNMLRQKLCS